MYVLKIVIHFQVVGTILDASYTP